MPEMIAIEKDLHTCMRIRICLDLISELNALDKYLYNCIKNRKSWMDFGKYKYSQKGAWLPSEYFGTLWIDTPFVESALLV
jgi:hypothetical protein